MADQTVRVQEVEPSTKEKVALGLMERIAYHADGEPKEKNRDYFLNLYADCYRAVAYGWNLKAIQKEHQQQQ